MGVDQTGGPYELFKSIEVSNLFNNETLSFPTANQKRQPFIKSLPDNKVSGTFNLKLTSRGHYNEPEITLKVDLEQLLKEKKVEYMCVLDAQSNKYELVLQYDGQRNLLGPGEFS